MPRCTRPGFHSQKQWYPLCMHEVDRQVPGGRCQDSPAARGCGQSTLSEDDRGWRPQTALVTVPDCVPGVGSCGGCHPLGKLALFPIPPCLSPPLYFPLQLDYHLEKISFTSKFSAVPTKMQAPRRQKTLSVSLSVLHPWCTERHLACGRYSMSIC